MSSAYARSVLSRCLSGRFIGNLSERALVFAGRWRAGRFANLNYSLCGAILRHRPRWRPLTGPDLRPLFKVRAINRGGFSVRLWNLAIKTRTIILNKKRCLITSIRKPFA